MVKIAAQTFLKGVDAFALPKFSIGRKVNSTAISNTQSNGKNCCSSRLEGVRRVSVFNFSLKMVKKSKLSVKIYVYTEKKDSEKRPIRPILFSRYLRGAVSYKFYDCRQYFTYGLETVIEKSRGTMQKMIKFVSAVELDFDIYESVKKRGTSLKVVTSDAL